MCNDSCNQWSIILKNTVLFYVSYANSLFTYKYYVLKYYQTTYVNKQILMMERKVQPLNITLSLSNTKYERPYEHGVSGLIFILKLDTRLMIYLDFGRI